MERYARGGDMAHGSFATAVNCMDGRVQQPVSELLGKMYGVQYVDTITEPGPVRILAEGTNKSAIDSIAGRIDISVNKHGSRTIALAAHHDCAGNPVDKETQLKQLAVAVEFLKSSNPGCEVIGLWVDDSWNAVRVI
jgi:hypothetical protein